jgi:glycogen synthase
MKVLLVGPLPPPNGGISVHVTQTQRRLIAAGAQCHALNPAGVGGKVAFVRRLVHYASQGWSIQVHTNGHNRKSWLLALLCGAVAKVCRVPASVTLHSGMAPHYLAGHSASRTLARSACRLYDEIVCVSRPIEDSLASIGVDRKKMEVRAASAPPDRPAVTLDQPLVAWMENHRPLLCTTLFFRPEYGFPLLVSAIARLRQVYPSIGCIVMGSCEHGEEAPELVRQASVEGQMLLLGDVEHDRCLSVMTGSDLFIRPTLHDGDSISVREALALGVPVLASRTGTRPDGAHLFTPGDLDDLVAQATRLLPTEVDAKRDRRVCA